MHYAFAVFLLQEQPDKALEEFKRELELQPEHALSLMQIAYEYVNRGDAQTALPWAKQAVAAAPNSFAARKALGQALLDTGDVEGAIKELELGVKLAPESPGLHFTLARAYQRAGRPGRCRACARRIHETRSAGPHAAERCAVRGGKMTVLRVPFWRCAFSVCWRFMQGRRSNNTHRLRPSARPERVSRGRPGSARRRRCPRPARAPVRDLSQADFEMLEDGVPQKLGSFTPVFESAPAPAAAAPKAARSRSARREHEHPAGRRQRTAGHRAGLRSANPGSAASGRAGGARLSRQERRGAVLHRYFRHRSGADALRAVHAQREHAPPGADEGRRAAFVGVQQPRSGNKPRAAPDRGAIGSADRRQCRRGRRPWRGRGDGNSRRRRRSSRRWSRR